jgi:hypothetical protein
MIEGHNQFTLLGSLVQRILVYEDNLFINNKVTANYSKNQARFKYLTLKVKVIYK